MHDAYEETSILNITVQIESMAAYGRILSAVQWDCQKFLGIDGAFIKFLIVSDDNLLIGTREGHLIMYNVPSVFDDSHKLELLRHSKNFNKKRINQIDVVPEYNLLIILTGISVSILRNELIYWRAMSLLIAEKLQIILCAFTT